jgi:hypothetical protein
VYSRKVRNWNIKPNCHMIGQVNSSKQKKHAVLAFCSSLVPLSRKILNCWRYQNSVKRSLGNEQTFGISHERRS